MRRGASDPDPDATLKPRKRGLVLTAAGLILAGGLAWAFVGFVGPVSPAERQAREEALCRGVAGRIEEDAGRLRRIATRLQAAPEFAEVVDGGGAAVRPERLFSVLARSLPQGQGWGAAFYDRQGRAVAWAGEAADIASDRPARPRGLTASFHVTRFNLALEEERGSAPDTRGVLVVSRSYPTGILQPDLGAFFGGEPSSIRVRARASSRPDRLIALFVEATTARDAEEDVQRVRARGGSILAALVLVLASPSAGFQVAGLLAGRAILLLGSPRATTGVWQRLADPGLGILATPADICLTGLALLLLVRRLGFSHVRERSRPTSRLSRALYLALVVIPASVPFLLGRWVGGTNMGFFDDLNLLPESVPVYLVRLGGVALVLCAVAGAAALAVRAEVPLAPRLPGVAGSLALAIALLGGGAMSAGPLAVAGTFLLSLALASRVERFREQDLLGRATTLVLLALSGVASSAPGLQDGKTARLDAAMRRAEARDGSEGPGETVRLTRWEQRLRASHFGAWLPADERTLLSDLARALWIRGADEEFPRDGDILTIRTSGGELVSSFGVTRPGAEPRGEASAVSIPVPGLVASWSHVPYPRESDRDALLVQIVERDLPGRIGIERFEYDAAGRAVGALGDEPSELPPAVQAAARRLGFTTADVETAGKTRRIRVRSVTPGFVGYAAASDPPLVTFGSAVAAVEASLLLILPVLMLGLPSRRRALARGRFLGTFRTRLVALVSLLGAVPLAGSIFVVRLALERHSAGETARKARGLLAESRRALSSSAPAGIGPSDLNRVAAVVGSDLFLYRDGRLLLASRAVPVAAQLAGNRLTSTVAAALAEGTSRAAAVPARRRMGGQRIVEAAEPISGDGRDALAVVVAEDEAGRLAVDSLVLFTVAVALGAFGLGGRAALALSRPIEDLIEGAERIGSGAEVPRIERPQTVDLARLVEAFETMSERVRDRTELLARERATAVELLTNLTAAVILFREADGVVLLANPAADAVLPGADLASRLSGARWAPLRRALDEASQRPSPHTTRITVREAGLESVFRVVVAKLPPDGTQPRSLLLLEDLTDFVRADRLTAWVDAARSIAHDIKNPLTPIRLSAERLLRAEIKGEPVPPESLSISAANILRQVEILTDRIGRLARFADPAALSRSRLEANGVRTLLREVASDYAALERIRVRVEVEDIRPLDVDRPLVRDALTNFVLNAVEALGTREGSVVLAARAGSLSDGRPAVRFSCDDDGPGIPEEQLDRVFDPTFSTKSRGSGMGLAAARRAAERHGGEVFARNRPGGGLAIGFTLPAWTGD